MRNCLVKTLNVVVNNDNLKPAGVIRIPVAPYSGNTWNFKIVTPNTGDSKITVYNNIGEVVMVRDSVTTDSQSYIYPNIGQTGGYYEVDNKYAIVRGFSSNVSYDNRDSLPNLTELEHCGNLTEVNSGTFNGTMLSLAKIDSLINIFITYFTGDILDYVRERIKRGFNNGAIDCNIYSDPNAKRCTVTFNGISIYSNTFDITNKPKLKWEGMKIYLLTDGQHNVRVYGYTDEEIATMRQSGGEMENVTNVIRVG